MKKVFVTLAVLVMISSFSVAQAKKGDLLLGASSNLKFGSTSSAVEFQGESYDTGSKTEFSFSPGIGYFVIDGLALGLDVNWESSKEKPEAGDEVKSNQFLIGPFAKYYFGSTNVKPYLETSFGFGSGKSGDQDYSLSGYGFGGGVALFLNDVVGIEFGVGYGDSTAKMKDVEIDYFSSEDIDFRTSGFAFEVGFSFSF